MLDFTEINYADEIVGIIIAIFQAVLIAIITKILLDRAFRDQRLIGKNLQKYGIRKVRADKGGTLSKTGQDIAFGLNGKLIPHKLDLCFITGFGFFRDYQVRTGYLKKLIANGCKIRVLLGNPNRGTYADYKCEDFENEGNRDEIVDYYYNIVTKKTRAQSFLERAYAMLISEKIKQKSGDYDINLLRERLSIEADKRKVSQNNGDHNYQVKYVTKIIEEIDKYKGNGGSIELRYYEDEYQMPIIMASSYTDNKSKLRNEETVYLWTSINAPIKETSESINVFCSVNVDDKSNAIFINDVSKSFDYLWNLYE